MNPDTSGSSAAFSNLSTFQLFDIAEAAAQTEAREWGEDPGMNLFLEDSIALVRRELETMPQVCGERPVFQSNTPFAPPATADETPAQTPAEAPSATPERRRREDDAMPTDVVVAERPRIFVMAGKLSEAAKDTEHYTKVGQYADVWIFGVPDIVFPTIPGVTAISLEAETTLTRERTIVVDSRYFAAALFAVEAGQLEEGDGSRYFEGFLTARPKDVMTAANRLSTLLKLPPMDARRTAIRRASDALTLSWHSRLNARFLESLEGQKLALRARSRELENLIEERNRLSQITDLARGYLGDRTWHELELTVEKGRTVIADYRDELTICFCDLVGFTRLSERLHPTEVAAILNDHYARLHDIVRAHGGWVDKFIGDAMLAIFPNPVEAMVAAQKMVRETRLVRVNDGMEQSIQVRVGLNTGTVAVANLGVPERRERTVLGDAVNLAQRLQSAADPRSVVIAERTFSRLPFAIARTLEPLDVEAKGISHVVLAYRWSVHSDRRAPDEKVALRGSLLNAARRAPILERLQGGARTENTPAPVDSERLGRSRGHGAVHDAPPPELPPTPSRRPSREQPARDWTAVHEPGYDPDA